MLSLVIPGRPWRTALDQLVTSPGLFFAGPTGIAISGESESVLVRSLEVTDAAGIARLLRRWSELVVLGTAANLTPQSTIELIERLAPSRHHRLTALLLGRGQIEGRASGHRWNRGQWQALDRVEIVGPGMPRCSLTGLGSDSGALIDHAQVERYSRTVGALGTAVHNRVRNSSAAVIGCGRSGSLAAEVLAMLGLGGPLVLIDADRLALGNFDATFGVRPGDVGRFKVSAVGESLRAIRPDLDVVEICRSAKTPEATAALREVDLIVTTVDQDLPRLVAAQLASAYLKVHLDIGTGVLRSDNTAATAEPGTVQGQFPLRRRPPARQMGADIRLILPGDQRCVVCWGGLRRMDEARYELLAPSGALHRGGRSAWWQERLGSLATINAAAVGVGCQLWLDVLAGISDSRWVQLQWTDDGRVTSQSVDLPAAQPCAGCGPIGLGDFRFGSSRNVTL